MAYERRRGRLSVSKDGGSAFPQSFSPDYPTEMVGGLSILDWFAGQALTGILANPNMCSMYSGDEAAEAAYRHAQNMLKYKEWV